MYLISGTGTTAQIVASTTFPLGFTLNAFADDVDPMDFESLDIGDAVKGVNGDMIVWSKANTIKLAFAVIPNSPDDVNLGILLKANFPARGKTVARDQISGSVIFPDNSFVNLSEGFMLSGIPINPIASAGRIKTKVYKFAFGDYSTGI